MSWVIVEIATNKAVMETWSRKIVAAINADKYQAVPIREYLGKMNAEIANA